MNNAAEKVWNTCGYVRLSREDGDKTESNSITGQKELIRDYLSRCPAGVRHESGRRLYGF